MQDEPDPRASWVFFPIGTIHSPFTDPAGMPIQPAGAQGIRGSVHLDSLYGEGLTDIDGFSRIILIYAFHRSRGFSLTVIPFLDTHPHGVFATRAPRRPNAIGVSVVRLLGRKGTVLTIEDVDVLDGTPLLDIKPYIPAFDCFPDERTGWLQDAAAGVSSKRSDGRFSTTR